MKWIKRISLDFYMLCLHFKTLVSYLWVDLGDFLKDFFKFKNDTEEK